MNEIGQSAGKNLEWLAGFLEGDGSIVLTKQPIGKNRSVYVPMVRFTNTDALIIENCENILKSIGVGSYFYCKKTKNGYAFDLTVKGFKRVKEFLPNIIPYLIGKKKAEAQLLLKWIASREVTGNSKTYTEEEILMANQIAEMHHPNFPQRLNARPLEEGEDIVRTVQRCAELSRNAIAEMKIS